MFWQSLATGALRSVMNNAMAGTTPDQLREAIRSGTSLWGSASENIKFYASQIPPVVIQKGSEVVQKIETDYGGFTNLVMIWLEKDQPTYHAVIKETPAGYLWLNNQVYDILRGIGMLK